ncbi:MAG: hypothetical protein JSU81_06555, partial [Candidatus Coatesbacteria bacterium]
MRKISALIVTGVVAASAAGAASETFEWSGGADARALRVSHVVGEVNVTVGGEEVVVRATKKCEDADVLAALEITVEESGNAVVVGVEYPEDLPGKAEATVDFDISVPEGLARVEVASAAGEVNVADVPEAEVSTASGSVHISGVNEKLEVSAASGDVVVDSGGKPTA